MAHHPWLLLLAALLAQDAGAVAAAPSPRATQTAVSPASGLDFEVFETRVQPIFLNKRKGLARCYVCHSQTTAFRLQRLLPGRVSWTEEQTRQNFEAVQRQVVPGQPLKSRLLLMPLAAEAGGVSFHPGGRRWTSQEDPEWQMLADWVKAAGGASPD